jgi:hypothetical protein
MSNSQRPFLPHWQPTPGGVFARTDAYMERREKEGPAPVDSDPTSFSAIEEELAKDLLKRCSTTVEPASKQDADLTEQKLEPTVVHQHTHHAGPTYHAGTTHGRIPLDRRAAILALRWYTDKTWDEISKCLGVSPDGASGVVKRAKVGPSPLGR